MTAVILVKFVCQVNIWDIKFNVHLYLFYNFLSLKICSCGRPMADVFTLFLGKTYLTVFSGLTAVLGL